MSAGPNDDIRKKMDERQQQWDAIVGAAVREVEAAVLKPRPEFHLITFFGAMGVHPRHLAIWCFLKRDKDLRSAQAGGWVETIQQAMRSALAKHGYPADLAATFQVTFATDEDVRRTCGGDYRHYLQ